MPERTHHACKAQAHEHHEHSCGQLHRSDLLSAGGLGDGENNGAAKHHVQGDRGEPYEKEHSQVHELQSTVNRTPTRSACERGNATLEPMKALAIAVVLALFGTWALAQQPGSAKGGTAKGEALLP